MDVVIRFIVEKKFRDRASGAEWVSHVTVDANVPALQATLGGGMGCDCYEISTLIGAEVHNDSPKEPPHD